MWMRRRVLLLMIEATARAAGTVGRIALPESYRITLGGTLGGKPTVSFYAHGIGGSGVARSVRTAFWNTRSVRTVVWNTLALLPRGIGDGFTPRRVDEPRPQLHGSHDCLR